MLFCQANMSDIDAYCTQMTDVSFSANSMRLIILFILIPFISLHRLQILLHNLLGVTSGRF